MGQVADDMLNGTCCQYCGVWHTEITDGISDDWKKGDEVPVIEWEPQGFPWTCPDCEDDDD